MPAAAGASPLSGLDTSRPNASRMYDYMLGGTDNFAADREAADRLRAVAPELSQTAWANREFHQRATAWMAEAGITQFIDVGCGLPTMENTHQVVQRIMPGARVAYVDYDPAVIAHAKALLAKGGDNVAVILGDLRNPAGVLDALRETGLLDLGQPCGLLITAVLHFIPASHDPVGAVRRLTGALAGGSYLALSHVTIDGVSADRVEMGLEVYRSASAQMNPRNKAEVTSFFDGMELLPPWPGAEPGVSRVSLWGKGKPPAPGEAASESWWAGMACKP
jgi:SAM-dependent methyltransferase